MERYAPGATVGGPGVGRKPLPLPDPPPLFFPPRFNEVFQRDEQGMPRSWAPSVDIPAVALEARRAAARLLAQLAAVQLGGQKQGARATGTWAWWRAELGQGFSTSSSTRRREGWPSGSKVVRLLAWVLEGGAGQHFANDSETSALCY